MKLCCTISFKEVNKEKLIIFLIPTFQIKSKSLLTKMGVSTNEIIFKKEETWQAFNYLA